MHLNALLRPRLSLSRLSDAIPQDHKDHCALFFCFSSQIFFGPAGRCYQLAVRLIIPHLTHLPVLIKSALLCVPRRSRHRSSNLPTSQHPLSCTSSFAILELTMDVDRGLFGCQAKRRSVKICCQCCNLFIYFFSAFCCCCRCQRPQQLLSKSRFNVTLAGCGSEILRLSYEQPKTFVNTRSCINAA